MKKGKLHFVQSYNPTAWLKNANKHLQVLFVCIMLSFNTHAALNYVFYQSSGTYSAITGGTQISTGTVDDVIYSVTLPFNFTFNGVAYTTANSINVSSNGFLTFGATAPASGEYTPLSGTTGYAGAVSAQTGDMQGQAAGEIRWQTFGSAPNQTLVVQWKNYRRFGYAAGESLNYQIVLYESSNQIDVIYGTNTAAASSAGTSVQVGLRGASNADYLNRTTTNNWPATTAGGSNAATCIIDDAGANYVPSSGLTFSYFPNNECANATILTVGLAPITGNDGGATQTLAATCTGTANDDVWYKFTTSTAGNYLITVDGGASFNAVVDLRSGACNGTNVACADATANDGIETVTYSCAATTTYYIRVYDFDADIPVTPTFTIKVEIACTPPTITGTTPAARCGTGTVALGATASGGTINWYSVSSGGSSLGTGISYTTPSIASTTNYWVDATLTCTSARTQIDATVNNTTITGQPGNAATCPGTGTPSFTVTATGPALTYQWQEYISSWINVSNGGVYSGATSATLTITNPLIGMNGYKYRCVVSGTCPNATSDGNATLTVASLPPATSFSSHSNTTTTITWNWSSSATATSYEVSIDAGAWTDIGNVLTYVKTALAVNTTHSCNVRPKSACGTGTASGASSFFTSANVPSAPTVAAVSSSSISVDINVNSNPASTEFAIYCTTTSQYAQANGSLGASAVWQTDAVWGVKTITGLPSTCTTYTFNTIARNGDGDQTANSSNASAATTAGTISTFPYTENFEGVDPLSCSMNSTGAGAYRWQLNNWTGAAWSLGGNNPPTSLAGASVNAASGTHCLWLNDGTAIETEYLSTPTFDLTSLSRPSLRFYFQCYGGSFPYITVQGSSNGGGAWGGDWATPNINSLSNSGSFGGSSCHCWRLVTIPIPAAYTGSNVKIRIKAVTNNNTYDLWVDDIVVEDIGCSFDCISAPSLPSGWTRSPATGWRNEIYDGATTCTVHGVTHGNNYLPASDVNLMVTDVNDAWLFSPGLVLTPGRSVSYPVNFLYNVDPGSSADMEVMYGTSATIAAMTGGPIFSNASITGDLVSSYMGTATITPPTDGTYYLGWHAKTITGGGNLYLDNLGFAGFSILPIELNSFAAICTNGKVNVVWEVATQTNNNYFSIERTLDGTHFENIGMVQGAGSTNQSMSYSYTDENPLAGTSYYRLRQTDYDGKTEEFTLISVSCEKVNPLSIYLKPDQEKEELTIGLNGNSEDRMLIYISDVTGQIVQTTKIAVNSVSIINCSHLAPGVYFVFSESTEIKPLRFIKL